MERLWMRMHSLSMKSSNLNIMKQDTKTDNHLITWPELCKRFKTNIEIGLNDTQIMKRQKKYGLNRLTPPLVVPQWIKLCSHTFEGFAMLLWIGALLCITAFLIERNNLENLYLGIILIVVVVCSGLFSYLQESKSDAIMESFNKLIPQQATVIRNGNRLTVNAETLVPGDLVEFKGGDRIPADIRLSTTTGCKVDNSSLTGESEPQTRSAMDSDPNYLESRNMAFFSTNCVEGNARGLVINTGDRTVMGTIANLTTNLEQNETPLSKEIKHFIHLLTIVAVTLATIFFIISIWIGTSTMDAIVFFIAIIVASVPEGLLATVTVCLSLTAKRMAKKNCLVKNLQAVETLGATSVICSDKTGTLTANRMTVSHLWIGQQVFVAGDIEHAHIELRRYEPPMNAFEVAAIILTLCSKATFQPNQESIPIGRRLTYGDASESAILKFMEATLEIQSKVETVRQWWPKVAEIPFNSSNKYHLTVHRVDRRNDCSAIVCLKGAPENVLKHCTTYLNNEGQFPINDRFRIDFEGTYRTLGGKGERILGFAWIQLTPNQFPTDFEFKVENGANFPIDGFQFVGLISMIDPPRAGVSTAVDRCRAAGIKVMMVTGDHPITAKAIARSTHIISPFTKLYDKSQSSTPIISTETNNNFDNDHWPDSSLSHSTEELCKRTKDLKGVVLTGTEITKLGPSGLDRIIENNTKAKIADCRSISTKGEIVAVTGDGVNDSPALKKADIGIAMGITGSDVSKQAADLILLDDNFSSIVIGIEEGRLIYDNLKKSISYTLTSNVPEMMPFLLYMIIGIPLGLGTITILCIDLGTDIIPAISCAYEPPESDIMNRPPRGDNDQLVNIRMIKMTYLYVGFISSAAGFLSYFIIMEQNGFHWRQLFGIRRQWDSRAINDLPDRYGQEWSYQARMRLQNACQTAFFVAIVVTQWFDLIISKTRRNSIISQGFCNNDVMNFALIFETALTIFLCYCPGLNHSLQLDPLKWSWWSFGLPFGIMLMAIDEFRRYEIRHNPNGLVAHETYY
ncbi:Sodium/potassium-transporting ATPase subunit alpha-1 [Blomia tropicalis]|nr:Sodium/potassium-transporting ATPase subunit alpha-1 [Blomia tropicalis]